MKAAPLPVVSSRTSSASSPATYELGRFGSIADSRSSSVFVAQHSEIAERIVAKIVRYEGKTANDLASCARRWRTEKSFLEKLRHRNIVSLKAFDGRIFALYIERLPPSLHRGMHSPFHPSDAAVILRDALSALAYLETQQIVHNDIKPANIAYSPQRGAVLLDFEMARFVHDNGPVGGTPWYIPPEFAENGMRGAPGDI
ncbi:27e6b0ef-a855-4c85-aa69-e834c30132f5 [Thermothielavioides terrestris]|uniref:mitogen-activated protein kinase n=1 Tax=Thermothielavioides terrestris TaxID=2587410 RepID=A0A3S4F116_9PEZI|nr:27e6b0ef-a855-4c85-aa69-e834c30132f5 [Thermothielavioides terrestris]